MTKHFFYAITIVVKKLRKDHYNEENRRNDEKFTQEKEIVLDPFMGTGTTGVSCKKFGRIFMGIEKSQEYFDIAFKRINEKSA